MFCVENDKGVPGVSAIEAVSTMIATENQARRKRAVVTREISMLQQSPQS